MTPVETAILRTLAYFDIFSYPLTSWELWKWGIGELGKGLDFSQLQQAFRNSPILQSKIGHQHGFFFLQGHEEIIATRQARYRLALLKAKRARRIVRTLVRFPFIQAVALCNSMGLANARPESDLDLFILCKPGHVWLVRFFTTAYARLRNIRPQPEHREDTVCLSFFLSTDQLSLQPYLLPDDPYFTMWLATLVPLHDPAGYFPRLWQANPWCAEKLPHAQPRALAPQRAVSTSWVARVLAPVVGWHWVERLVAKIQRRILPAHLKALANQDTRVVMNNHILKFHDNDRRAQYAQAYRERAASVGAPL
ncbi:MAG: hypothetical protein WCV85_00530 [Patescibacteria group bacterium]|jgi:hypothetical protein